MAAVVSSHPSFNKARSRLLTWKEFAKYGHLRRRGPCAFAGYPVGVLDRISTGLTDDALDRTERRGHMRLKGAGMTTANRIGGERRQREG
jgi:hypothetical protein